eukprot:scaffold16482_cov59-Phaeocystis_antarctica.AAC.2
MACYPKRKSRACLLERLPPGTGVAWDCGERLLYLAEHISPCAVRVDRLHPTALGERAHHRLDMCLVVEQSPHQSLLLPRIAVAHSVQ